MKGWLMPVAAGVAVGILAVIAATALGPEDASRVARVDALSAQLRCPDCQGLSVADSPSASAAEIRRQIVRLVDDGATDDEVRAQFVARYGDWILLAPTSPIAWVIPFAVVIGAAIALAIRLTRRRPAVVVATPPGADVARRVHEEAEALDA